MRMSGLNFSNISAGFGQASEAASHAADVKAREALEQMRDARAENLARLNWTRDMLKQKDMLDRQATLQHDAQVYAEGAETRREAFLAEEARKSQQAYLANVAAGQAHQLEVENLRQSGREKIENDRLIAQTHFQLQDALTRIDQQKFELSREIDSSVKGNFAIASITDPQKRAAAMAADPTIGKLLEEQQQLDATRAQTIRRYTMYSASLGDPTFQGIKTEDLPGGAPGSATVPGESATPSRTDNPLDQHLPAYPSNPSADNAPAVGGPTPSANAPTAAVPSLIPATSSSAAPMLTGLQRPPTQSFVGPLVKPPQLIPLAPGAARGGPAGAPAGAPGMPSVNFGSTLQQGTPQLIQGM